MTILDTTPGWGNVAPDPARDYHDIRVHALMVVGPGEAGRWMDAAVRWLAPAVDTLFLYMDAPDAATADLADELAKPHSGVWRTSDDPGGPMPVHVWYRELDQPGFLDHEALFRSSAWAAWEANVQPEPGDWVLVPDADEFWVPVQTLVGCRDALHASAGYAQELGIDAVAVPIPEVWAFAPDGCPMVRVDGQWAGNAGPRLIQWTPELAAGDPAAWNNSAMGCGSVPAVFTRPGLTYAPAFGQILHYGYADPADVASKASRYQSMANHGHNNAHVQSITDPPKLRPLSGVGLHPTVWRGPRPS